MKNSKPGIFVSLTIFIMLVVASFTALSVTMNADKTEDRAVSGFHTVDLSGGYTLEIMQGEKESLRIEGDEEDLQKILTEVKNGILEIKVNGRITNSKKIKLYLTFKKLEKISSSGSIAMTGKGTLKFDKLDLDLSGAAVVDLDIEAASLDADMSGSTDAKLRGRIADLDIDISGAGSLDASSCISQNVEIEISGSGDARVNAAKTLNVEISGSGSVAYHGDPAIKKSVSGSGSVKKAG